MGAVYRVRHRQLGRIAVVKVLHSHFRQNVELRARFLHEARVASQLRHPNIADVHDFFVGLDDSAYIVMEYIDGTDLRVLQSGSARLDPGLVAEVALGVLAALQYLHAKRFVHRDLSPDNVMLCRGQVSRSGVKLIDLGIARSLEADSGLTATGLFVGKVQYASPEQFESRPGGPRLDERSDLYSMGVLLYELLTGVCPFPGTEYTQLIAGHLFQEPIPFLESDPEGRIPPALRAVVLRALKKKPDDRFQSASDFSRAIESALAQPALVGGPQVGEVASPRAARSSPSVLRVTGGLVVLAGILGGVSQLVWNALPGRPSSEGTLEEVVPYAALDATEDLRSDGAYFAIVIGNSAYHYLPRLETPVADATALADVLAGRYGFGVDRVINGSRSEIIKVIEGTRRYVTEADNLVLFYAGHGWIDPATATGYWQPVDAEPDNTANWISAPEISELLAALPAKRIAVIADSCYSGAFALGAGGSDRRRPESRSRLVMTSGGLQPVRDAGGSGHSLFASALLASLREEPKSRTFASLFSEVRLRLASTAKTAGEVQSPEFGVIGNSGDEGGGFVFLARPAGG